MITRDIGDNVFFGFGKAGQFRIFDKVKGMFVMRFVRDVISVICQARGS